MKIERLNENQIRCTLNKADLADRELLISELAYGTERARELFRDMMQQASVELGFEADDIPLMIEAIPVSSECLILIITKVEDPEELDTRFSRFSRPSDFEDVDFEDDVDDEDGDDIVIPIDGDETILNTIEHVIGQSETPSSTTSDQASAPEQFFSLADMIRGVNTATTLAKAKREAANTRTGNPFRVFAFPSLDGVKNAATKVASHFHGDSSLYKNTQDGIFYLLCYQTNDSLENFQRSTALLSEYGLTTNTFYALPQYMGEHFKPILKEQAIQSLASL